MEALLADRIERITPDMVEKLRAVHEEGIIFLRLTVKPDQFYHWHTDNPLSVEYSNKIKNIILIAPSNSVHQILEGAISLFLHIYSAVGYPDSINSLQYWCLRTSVERAPLLLLR